MDEIENTEEPCTCFPKPQYFELPDAHQKECPRSAPVTPFAIKHYSPDVRQRVINLRKAGRSWSKIIAATGVSKTQVQRWVQEEEQAIGELTTNLRGWLPGYRPNDTFEQLCLFYESKFQRLAHAFQTKMDVGEPGEQTAVGRAAMAAYAEAYKVMKERKAEGGEGENDAAKYKKHLDGQFQKYKDKLDAVKRAKRDVEKAEVIEMRPQERSEDKAQ